MTDTNKTKAQLIEELKEARKTIRELGNLAKVHKNMEHQLQKSNIFLRNILESSSSISIISTDMDHNIVYWNRGAERIFGYRADEVVGKQKINILYPPEDTVKNLDNIRHRLFEERDNINCTFKEVTKTGQQVWINMNLTPRLNENREVVGVLGIGEDITKRKSAEETLAQSLKKLKKSLEGVIHVMELTVETRDPYTAGHQRRVANLALAIAKEMKLPDEQVDGVHFAGTVHDLGKLSVPAEILSKPGILSDIQVDMIKTHPQVGFDIVKNIDFPWPIAEIMLQHHERLNGSGYPKGLTADKILPEAKILAVADVVEAMASHRPYRASLGIEKALNEIEQKKGVYYDSKVVDACMKLFRDKGFEMEQPMESEAMAHLPI